VFGAIPGIGLAIVIAVIEFLWDGWRPHSAVLGRVDSVKGYHDIARYPEAHLIPGLVLFRWDAPLFFANAELFHERVMDAVASSPTPARWLVIAAEPVTSVDVTAADAVSELEDALHAAGVELCFAEMKDPVKDKLKRFGSSPASANNPFLRRSAKLCARISPPTRSSGLTGKTDHCSALRQLRVGKSKVKSRHRGAHNEPGEGRTASISKRLERDCGLLGKGSSHGAALRARDGFTRLPARRKVGVVCDRDSN